MSTLTPTDALDVLRQRYEASGYAFTSDPAATALPPFMQGFVPDAIATKDGDSIAISVRARRRDPSTTTLKDVAERFRNQQGWRFLIAYSEEVEQATLKIPDRSQILARLSAIENMAANDNWDAALVLAWAILEATARLVAQEAGEAHPSSPREALQILEHLGRIDHQSASEMRDTLGLRNQIVHGDLTVAVPPQAVSMLVSTVRSALAA